MKIAILGTRGIPAEYGGFETFAEHLSVGLVQRGHEVTVFCELGDQRPSQFKGVRLKYVKTRKVGPLTTLLFDVTCLWQSRSAFDVVYMLGYGASALCWLPRVFGAQVWINMDGLEWARAKWSRVARLYLRCAEAIAMMTPNRIIADAASIKANLQSRYRKLPICDVIPYGCDIVSTARAEELSSFGLTPGSYYLAVCRFEPENHVREIVEGFMQSKSNDRLVLVGDHKRPTSYIETLTDYKDERILFVGPVYEPKKIQALRCYCRAYIHGHSVGGTNPSLLEAMGCGNLVIAHDNVFNREVLANAAFFFSTPDQISKAIHTIETGLAETIEMQQQVLERVRSFYTWEGVLDSYCNLLEIASVDCGKQAQVIEHLPVDPHKASVACSEMR